jgi:hypothetical protein
MPLFTMLQNPDGCGISGSESDGSLVTDHDISSQTEDTGPGFSKKKYNRNRHTR